MRTKNERILSLSKCSVCNSKNSKFIKRQEATGLLSNLLGLEIPIFSDLPILNTLL